MGLWAGTEGGGSRGGGEVTVFGPHLSALLWDNWKGSLWLLLPSREPGTAGRQCHQLASLQVTPPHTHTAQLCSEAPVPGNSSIILSHLPSLHYSYPLRTCVHSLHCNDNLCRFMCFFTSVFMSSVCV